ncbi:MAG: cytochrome c-type biogenesis protein [Pseudomonadota bacterium]|nr:cytochrome c-type biogenesis protein [Pseudomonadota bacterium]
MQKLITVILIILISQIGNAIDTGPAFENPLMQAQYDRIINEVRCLVCQNQSIKSSNVFLAVDLRNEIKRLIAAGKTNKEIGDYLVDRYGEFVLYRPRYSGNTLFLWFAPILLLAVGLLIAFKVINSKKIK